jgi:tRNA U38,U39,U40 pseudouridine synthase TruA
MLNYDLQEDTGILVLKPEGKLEAADFTTLASRVDAYLEGHDILHGVLIHAKAFPGWKDFSALLAHLKFVRRHHQRIEKIAVVADGGFATVMPNLASHFVHAQVRHFELEREDAAWDWLAQIGTVQARSAA